MGKNFLSATYTKKRINKMKIAWKSSFSLQKEFAMTQTKPASIERGEQLALFSFRPLPDRVGEFQTSQSDRYWLIYTLAAEKNMGEPGLRNVQGQTGTGVSR